MSVAAANTLKPGFFAANVTASRNETGANNFMPSCSINNDLVVVFSASAITAMLE